MASVLIVDDEQSGDRLVRRRLRAQGNHIVTCAHTGEDAIAAFETSRPDLVLLDLRLPDMSASRCTLESAGTRRS
jgi:CheY-like chemotaxis protein